MLCGVSVPNEPVLIVGAGLAGLRCARTLEAAGVDCLLLEASDDVGGRVRTDAVDGFLLDRGFQVYLDSYPESKATLDHAALDLRPFDPGALIRLRGEENLVTLVDPLRVLRKSFRTALSPAATFTDKWHVASLRARVTGDPEVLLSEPAGTTLEFLRAYGFSETIIEGFFRPFFGGVFLDGSLATSSRLFLWLFRLFADGRACLPAGGMGQIPTQIAAGLKGPGVRLGTYVESIDGRSVTLGGGQKLTGRAVVVATEATVAAGMLAGRLPSDFNDRPPQSSTTLYFAADEPPVADNLLVLNGTGDGGPVNTVATLTNAAPSYSADGRSLLSVSVVGKADADDATLEAAVRKHLAKLLPGADVSAWSHLRTYRIAYSLPDSRPSALERPHKSTNLGDGLFLCGDHRDTASINGAMLSGRRAAEAVAASL